MKILVVEDNLDHIKHFIEVLGRYELIIIDKAEEAVDLLRTQVFDMIFLDNDLRDGGFGADVATYLSENSENPNNRADIVIHCWDDKAIDAMKDKLGPVCTELKSIKYGPELFDYLGLTSKN